MWSRKVPSLDRGEHFIHCQACHGLGVGAPIEDVNFSAEEIRHYGPLRQCGNDCIVWGCVIGSCHLHSLGISLHKAPGLPAGRYHPWAFLHLHNMAQIFRRDGLLLQPVLNGIDVE
jgi:hypothetical protein